MVMFMVSHEAILQQTYLAKKGCQTSSGLLVCYPRLDIVLDPANIDRNLESVQFPNSFKPEALPVLTPRQFIRSFGDTPPLSFATEDICFDARRYS